MYKLIFYLTIVNKILRHCHSWLARQYHGFRLTKIFSFKLLIFSYPLFVTNVLGAQKNSLNETDLLSISIRCTFEYPQHMFWLGNIFFCYALLTKGVGISLPSTPCRLEILKQILLQTVKTQIKCWGCTVC